MNKYEKSITDKVLRKHYNVDTEFKFHPKRKWRFDYALIEKKLVVDEINKKFLITNRFLAIEIEGGTWINGRHNHPTSIQNDMEKYNAAALIGWHVLRYTPKQFIDGLPLVDLEIAPKEIMEKIENDNRKRAERKAARLKITRDRKRNKSSVLTGKDSTSV